MAIPNLWRTKKQRYSLQGELCANCARAVFPPREVCPHCHKPTQAVAQPAVVDTKLLVLDMAALTPQPLFHAAVVGDD